ncbi:MAG: cobalamin biosynthesis protein CbiX [Fibrobacteres bacterium]|nr:cobalamin biosynthesis protein CbiX [Fibrobacterota bacterium]
MKNKPVLILLGHGSRTAKTLEEMEDLAAKLQDSSANLTVSTAFLTLLEPDLSQAVAAAVESGAGEIHVLPLFFFSGKHVLEDIPAEFERLRSANPGVKLVLREAVGRHPAFFGFLLEAGGFG